jgi:hypothetical protein
VLPRASVARARSPELGDRIAAILQADRRRQPVGVPRALLAALAALAVALPLAALSPAAEAEPHPDPHPGAGADDGDRRVHRTHETDEPKRGYFTAPRYADQCAPGLLTGRRFGAIVNADGDEWKIDVFHGVCELEIEMEGDVDLRPDGRGIERMGRNARMTIEEDAGVDRTLVVTAGSNGVPQYRVLVDGRERPIDDEARAWFRGVLTEIFRATGLQAEERVAHFLERGGVPAVLAEVEHITSDHVAGLYFHATLARHRVSAAEATTILELAGETLGSDHTLSELMMAVPTELLSDRRARDAYVGAARSIGSDHDTGRVLHALLEDRELPSGTLDELMVIAESIGSDHESSEVLLALAERYPPGHPLPEIFFQVASDIGSDHDLSRVLIELIDRGRTDRATVEAVLRAAAGIGSDHDLSRLLVRIAEEVTLDGDLRQQYLDRAEDVGSDHDHDRVISALNR